MKIKSLLFIICFLFSINVLYGQSSEVLYVDKNADGRADGTSWDNAFNELQYALNFINNSSEEYEIWVAKGEYNPSPNATYENVDRNISFYLQNNIEIYGGFSGTENQRTDRDWSLNETVLTGFLIEENDDPFDPIPAIHSYTVVKSIDNNETAIIDGFIIKKGLADGDTENFEMNGGGIYIENGEPILRNLLITDNRASNNGGGLYSNNSAFKLSLSTLTDNGAEINGGAIFINSADPTILESNFTNNTASSGGGIFIHDGNSIIEKVEVENNDAGGTGGGIYILAGSSKLNEVLVQNNQAGSGGGLATYSNPVINDIRLLNNTCTAFGGGYLISGNSNLRGSPVINNLTASGNKCGTGGGLSIFRSDPIMNYAIIENNVAVLGAGFSIRASDSQFSRVIVKNNIADESGGGVFLFGDVIDLHNLEIFNNSSEFGGGLYIQSSANDVTLDNLIIHDNTAIDSGGGIYVSGNGTGELKFVSNFFANNNSENIKIAANESSATILNSVIYNADSYGLEVENIRTDIINSTLYSSDIRNIKMNKGDLFISNSIIWNIDDQKQLIESEQDVFIRYSIVNESTLTNFEDVGNNITETPEFVDANKSDLRLSQISPAIDSGLEGVFPDSIEYDLNFEPRLFDGNNDGFNTIDIGAYEWIGEFYQPRSVDLKFPINNSSNLNIRPEFSWDVESLADFYQIQISDTDEFRTVVIDHDDVADIEFKLTKDLDYKTPYFWRVRASNKIGKGNWSSVWSFQTIVEQPESVALSAPENGAINVAVDSSLTWFSAERAEQYILQISENGLFENILLESTSEDTSLAVNEVLNFESSYYWRVKASNVGGESEWSSVWSFTTQFDQPQPVSLIFPENEAVDITVNPTLRWQVVDNAQTYHVQLSTTQTFGENGIMAVDSTGNESIELYITADLESTTEYFWRVNATNEKGTSDWSEVWSFITGIATTVSENEFPTEFTLNQNYPNPFNPSTIIQFGIPEAGFVTLEVFNMLGQRVATLANEQRSQGWHEVTLDASNLSSGTYIYRLQVGSDALKRKLMLIK